MDTTCTFCRIPKCENEGILKGVPPADSSRPHVYQVLKTLVPECRGKIHGTLPRREGEEATPFFFVLPTPRVPWNARASGRQGSAPPRRGWRSTRTSSARSWRPARISPEPRSHRAGLQAGEPCRLYQLGLSLGEMLAWLEFWGWREHPPKCGCLFWSCCP